MNRKTELLAKLRSLAQSKQQNMIESIHGEVCNLHTTWPKVPESERLSSARISSLRFAAQPHHSRPTAKEQLKRLESELERMNKQAEGKSIQQAFYQRMKTFLWLNPSEKPPWAKNVPEMLNLDMTEQKTWHDTVRLIFAIAVLDTLAAIYITQPIQQKLDSTLQGEGGYRLCL
jgi:hypothetical protein